MKTLSLLLSLIVLCVVLSPAAAYKKRKEWTEEELEALERAWEANDAEEDLDSPERRQRLEMEAGKKASATAASEVSPEGGVGMPPGGPPMMGAQTGPKMMFVDLLPEKAPDKTAWSSRDVELLTKKWRRMLITGGVSADVYNLDNKVLVSIEHHLLPDAKEFLFDQSEVDFLTVDQQKMYPSGRHK